KILIAPDSFKGSATSSKAAEAIGKGVHTVFPDADLIKIPVADGGEGTVEALTDSMHGEIISKSVKGPLGEAVEAEYGILPGEVAVIEMASASGLPLVPDNKRNPLLTSTYGTGQLILDALNRGCKEIILGIGGSATNDGGTGMARALGYQFLDSSGNELAEGGGSLVNLAEIDDSEVDDSIFETKFFIACDVTNPLTGLEGASHIYGAQKGASPKDIEVLDGALGKLAAVVSNKYGRVNENISGAGAAGGLGFGLMEFCAGELKSGIEIVLDLINFDDYLDGVDLVISGEGRIDGQSVYGKVPVGIAGRAKKKDIPVLVIVGDIGPKVEAVYDHGIDAVMSSVNRAMSLEEAMSRSYELLIDSSARAMRMIKIGMDL
ncbi:MAG: glycerate kinase, partial [Spirochaetales bacterium]|nr:glycerate kinase [Spirochaetales bacterium]